jgi:hypothetical protein
MQFLPFYKKKKKHSSANSAQRPKNGILPPPSPPGGYGGFRAGKAAVFRNDGPDFVTVS